MAVYDVLPTQNLKYDDVRDTLNSSGGSVNNEMSSLFAEAANINKWSKYKPVISTNPFPTSSDWYGGDDGKCGLNFNPIEIDSENQLQSFQRIRSSYNDDTQWSYILPQAPFRLGDFRGYSKNAICPFNTSYKKDSESTIPVPQIGESILSYNLFRIDLEGGDVLPQGNIKLSDILYKYYDGKDYYLKDAKAGVVILVGTKNPFDESVDWSNSFTNSAGCIFISDKTIAQCQEDGYADVYVPVDYFVNVDNYRKQTYKVIGGFFFGYNNSRFVPLPFDDSHYPINTWKFQDMGNWAFISECIGWSQHPIHSEWNDVKWVYTEDMMAIRPISGSYLQLKFKMYLYAYEGTADVILNSSNIVVKYSDENGKSKEINGSVLSSDFTATSSSPISKESGNPTEVIISCDNALLTEYKEGYEFRIDIYYIASGQRRFPIYGMDFRFTSDYQ